MYWDRDGLTLLEPGPFGSIPPHGVRDAFLLAQLNCFDCYSLYLIFLKAIASVAVTTTYLVKIIRNYVPIVTPTYTWISHRFINESVAQYLHFGPSDGIDVSTFHLLPLTINVHAFLKLFYLISLLLQNKVLLLCLQITEHLCFLMPF